VPRAETYFSSTGFKKKMTEIVDIKELIKRKKQKEKLRRYRRSIETIKKII
jgi:hypothetical protein